MDKTIFSLHHIEGITLDAGEQVDEVAGGASSMGVDRIDEVGDWASEGQAAGVYGAGFTGKGARGWARGTGNKVSFDKELMEVGRVVEGDRGRGKEDGLRVEGSGRRM